MRNLALAGWLRSVGCLAMAWLGLLGSLFVPSEAWSQAIEVETPRRETQATAEPGTSADINRIERPFLWKLTPEEGAPQYLLGTIHVRDERILKLHPAITKALEETEVLYVELAPADQVNQIGFLTLPAGTRLSDKLDAKTIQRIDHQLGLMREGLSTSGLLPFRVWAWPLMLPNLKAQLAAGNQPVLDMLLVEKAIENEWPVRSLEHVDSQLAGFDKLTDAEQLAFLRATLDAMEEEETEEEDSLEELVGIYLRGDLDALSDEFQEEFFDGSIAKETADKIFAALMTSRNRVMAETIAKAIKDEPDTTHLFAAGAGHFAVGPTVVELLKEQGWKFERVEPSVDAEE
ncbi:MAG: TraB/GumN family protein [Planctomycetales bacterium]|nr:TraB/GumN family protein [Planctomycetales bacterium]